MIIKLGQTTKIKLQDGTMITATVNDNTKGIIIEKEGKEAKVVFEVKNKERGKKFDINNLDVTNVIYSGDAELIKELKSAMQKQFKSQRDKDQDALTVFEKAYFQEGIEYAKDWNYNNISNGESFRKTIDSYGKNKVTGKNAFSPYVNAVLDNDGKAKYELSLFKGKFLSLGNGDASAPKCKGAIEITDLSKEEIMELVKKMLEMTNEEVLEQYKPDILDDRIIMALLIDDEIQRYFESAGIIATDIEYGTASDIVHYKTNDGRNIRIINHSNIQDEDDVAKYNRFSIILGDDDEIQIDLDNASKFAETGQLSSIVVEKIQEDSSIDDELHKRIVSLLQNRFMNKETNKIVKQQDMIDLLSKRGRKGLIYQAQQQMLKTVEQRQELETNKRGEDK